MNSGNEIEPAPTYSPAPSVSRGRAWESPGELLGAAAFLLAVLFTVVISLVILTGSGSQNRDFVSYWASGQMLVHHQNPYDADTILRLEHDQGFPADHQVLIVRNPPSALLLFAPLGFLSYRAATLIWSLLLAACWIVSVRILWILQGRPARRFKLLGNSFPPMFVLFFFAPALICILAGQTGLFALLGLVLFLYLYRSRPFLAGASLWLCALKPHLFLAFAAALLLWIIVSRSYTVLAGVVAALAASSTCALLVDHSVWTQYTVMMHTIGIEHEYIPCLSIALRFAIHPDAIWLQYIPAALGFMWAVWFYWSRREHWQWDQDGVLLALVSMVVSPYAWVTDQVLALPALTWAAQRSSRATLLSLALISSVVEVAVLRNTPLHSTFYLWTAPAWLAWYVFAWLKSDPTAGSK